MNVEQILANIKWIKMTPESNPRLLDLADFDREQSTSTNDDCVRAIERIITAHLIPMYPKQLIGNADRYPALDDSDTWSGLALLSRALADD